MPPQQRSEYPVLSSPITSRIRNRWESMSATVLSFAPLAHNPSSSGTPSKPLRRFSNNDSSSSDEEGSSSTATTVSTSSLTESSALLQMGDTVAVDQELASSAVPLISSHTEETTAATILTSSLPSRCDKQRVLQLCFGATGIYSCYLIYGHYQEDVFRYRSLEDGRAFHYVWFLQVMECAVNIVFGLVGRTIAGKQTSPSSYRPFFVSGASQVFSKVLTSASLAAGLSFPVCILAKSAKMVPVMIGQLLLGGSKYSVKDYIFAGLVVLGTTILSMNKGNSPGKEETSFTTPLGLVFILASLVADGITGGLQKKLIKEMEAQPPTTFDFMLYTNIAMGAVALTIALLIGDLSKGMAFMVANPVLQQMIFTVCLLSACGQFFVFYLVSHFDAMVCATVTTSRKILSVVWSIATKGHVVSGPGYVGLLVAIAGIAVGLQDTVQKKSGPKKVARKRTSSNQKSVSQDIC